jgi:hypothetical protein
VPSKIFEDALLTSAETSVERKKETKIPNKEVAARLDFLARMYAANKDKYAEEETEEGEEIDEAKQD